MTLYSKGVLAKEGLLNDAALLGLSQQVDSELNNAKTLMNQLGYTDVTKAPALSVNTASLRVVPGQLKVQSIIVKHPIEPILPIHAVDVAPVVAKPVDVVARPGTLVDKRVPIGPIAPGVGGAVIGPAPSFAPISWLVNEAVIIASSLDLTHTNLIVDPSVNKLTIIVETLTCGAGAQITFDDSTVWHPVSVAPNHGDRPAIVTIRAIIPMVRTMVRAAEMGPMDRPAVPKPSRLPARRASASTP